MAVAATPTQEFIPIKEIRDGVVIMKDNSIRAILMASSINVALKSAEEQEALIFQFQNMLNSLDFSIQIFVQSRRLDIRPYIALLENRMREQLDDLLKIQTREYISFVKNLTETTNIMTKSFFVVVPYAAPIISGKGVNPIKNLFIKKTHEEERKNELEAFEENRTQLEQRVNVVAQWLSRLGIRTVQLGSEEIIELFYKLFNPGEMEKPMKIGVQ